jgi:GGDEF domain-containing protein
MLTASLLLWTRSHKEYQLSRNDRVSAQHDLTTGLDSGMAIVKKILSAQKRLKLRSAEGAVLAVMVLNMEALSVQVGLPGVQELLFRAAARVRRTSGLINPVGRYFDRCFIVVMETVRTPADAEEMAAALKYTLTQPMEIQGLHGEQQSLSLEVSVGSVRLTHQLDVAAVMHRVEQEACRKAGLPYTPMQDSADMPIQTEAGDLSSQYG